MNTKQMSYKTKYSLQNFSVWSLEEDNTNASYKIFHDFIYLRIYSFKFHLKVEQIINVYQINNSNLSILILD